MSASRRADQGLRAITPLDIALIAVLTALAVLMIVLLPRIGGDTEPLTARITCNGQLYMEIDLSAVTDPYEIELPTEPAATVSVAPGSIRFSQAACPDQICVQTGSLTRAGDTAACMPAGAVITLYGGAAPYDAIAY